MQFKYHQYVPKEMYANLFFREAIYERCGKDEEFRAFIWHICSEDFLFFIDTFIWQTNPTAEDNIKITPWICRDYQIDFFKEEMERLDTRLEKSDVAILKSRKMGLTWMLLIMYFCFWVFAPKNNPVNWGLTSKTLDDVDKTGSKGTLFAKLKFMLERLPGWITPEYSSVLGSLVNEKTSSSFIGEASTADMFRSGRVDSAMHDEFASLLESLATGSITSTGAVTDIRYVLSTPKGRNAYFRFYNNAGVKYEFPWWLNEEYAIGSYTSISKDGGKTFELKLLDTSFSDWVYEQRRGGHTRWCRFPDEYAFILDGKRRSPWFDTQEAREESDKGVAQEYEMSFGGSEDLYFDYNFIQQTKFKMALDPMIDGKLEMLSTGDVMLNTTTHDRSNISFWFEGVREGTRGFEIDRSWLNDRDFVLASDIAFGSGAANSVSVIYDRHSGEKVCRLKSPFIEPTDFAHINVYMCKLFNGAYHIYDATGFIGEKNYGDALRKTGYGNIYYRPTGLMGYNLDPKARSDLLLKYRRALNLSTILNRSESGLDECLEFIEEPGGLIIHRASKNNPDPSGARDAHGDEVIADALAAFVISEDFVRFDVSEPEGKKAPEGSLAWLLEEMEQEKLKADGVNAPEEYWEYLGAR